MAEDKREAAGREAYEEDVRRCPTYVFGTGPLIGKPRHTWDELEEAARESWRNDPVPHDYY